MNASKLTHQVCEIVEAAGRAVMEIYHHQESDWEVETKSDDSPVTLADKQANRIICEALEKLPQKYPILSEENKETPYSERKSFSRFWLVDPLDGTKEFLKKNDEFTVNVALVEGQQLVMGVVLAPVLEELYYAERGRGAWLQAHGKEEQLKAASFRKSDSGLGIVASRSHTNEETLDFIGRFDQPKQMTRGSSLKFLMLARGDAHVYPRMGHTMEWDTGAAQAILEEAGGRVVEAESGQPLLYNKPVLRNPYFIAYGRMQG